MKDTTMRTCTCPTCNTPCRWLWEEAFLRDGFFRGEDSKTETVAEYLRLKGYTVDIDDSFNGNPFIRSVSKSGKCVMRQDDSPGEVEPRDLLSQKIIAMLDDAFPAVPTTNAERAAVAEQELNRFALISGAVDHTDAARCLPRALLRHPRH